jgi:class 3 adenylate cyclase
MELRVVTAFFVDVVGSTALMVQLGPERLKRALDQAFGQLRTVIEAEGGTVANVIGDAIFAIFGIPLSHPDDPQRAMRAAQACIRWAERRRGAPVPLAVRIGVETGEVIVDQAAAARDGLQTSLGACVNLAARLQQLAEPGQILVGPTCHQFTGELAAFVAVGNVDLKGLGRQSVWRLVEVGARTGRADLPLIGRKAEMTRLRLAYRRARSRQSIFTIVSGSPGQGKTRLVEEFLAEIAGDATLLQARCRPGGEQGARSPLRDLLLPDDADQPEQHIADRLITMFSDALERDRVLTALAHSAGVIISRELTALPAGQRQDEIANGWRRYLAALAHDQPVVLWIDDLHWAEPEVVRLLERMPLGLRAPVLIVVTARPEFATQTAAPATSHRIRIWLEALDEADARALARHAGSADAAGIERAEGNPLFVIELSRARKISDAPDVPITLKGIIGARLDELPRQDCELLQRVAVVGETFTAADAALLTGRHAMELVAALDRLAQLAYLRPVSGGYRFHHALVHDVAYARLATVERMQLHARYALSGVGSDDAEALAHHLWEAVGREDAEWVWEDATELSALRDRARDTHIAAARRYAARFAYERAIEACRRASLFALPLEDRGSVEQTFGDVYASKGDADDAWMHYLRARQYHQDAGREPPASLYPSLLELPVYTSGMFVRRPEDALVETLLREGEAVAHDVGDTASLARLLALRAYQSNDAAQMAEALRLSETAVDRAALGFFSSMRQFCRTGSATSQRRGAATSDSIHWLSQGSPPTDYWSFARSSRSISGASTRPRSWRLDTWRSARRVAPTFEPMPIGSNATSCLHKAIGRPCARLRATRSGWFPITRRRHSATRYPPRWPSPPSRARSKAMTRQRAPSSRVRRRRCKRNRWSAKASCCWRGGRPAAPTLWTSCAARRASAMRPRCGTSSARKRSFSRCWSVGLRLTKSSRASIASLPRAQAPISRA